MTPMTDHDHLKDPSVIISNKVYDFLKAFTMVIAPSASAMYLGLSVTFDFPYVEIVVISTLGITAALGLFLISTSKTYHESDVYYDGKMFISENEEGELLYSLELNEDPEPLRLKAKIIFKVVNNYTRPLPESAMEDQD